ncbi:MAG: biotin--[acetyl-CoA-carboxylase] ligase [Deltaproteobacteria bacterium]|nr:biotin--[acetyl-CoA-carboxylase] ligase [Deltaproteobacteria bacterium]
MTELDGSRIADELALRGVRLGPVLIHQQTGSTNDDVRGLAAQGAPHGAVVIADAQTAGRGRGAHRWHSPPDKNLYLSLLWRPRLESSRLALLALAVGVGVARVVDVHLDGPRARIKWPNDVFVDDRKLAGILVEASMSARGAFAVIGVGLNVHTTSFPDDLASSATSLALAGGHDLERNRLAAEVVASIVAACCELELAVEEGRRPVCLEDLARRDWLLGRAVRVGECAGQGAGIDADGRLLVRRADGSFNSVVSGEISLEVGRG